ncbi:hypothetical protein CC78DRAFT_580421 [Lojkania enalia]|uniref:Uncharacterized protein n=1 Tax=Lojkania enalia TaxID=147567 RepID=A0A9P4K841_9PLEO|nr:hypothetical protein CC78DRAFT_580421 [Didymosphaeria enalia]
MPLHAVPLLMIAIAASPQTFISGGRILGATPYMKKARGCQEKTGSLHSPLKRIKDGIVSRKEQSGVNPVIHYGARNGILTKANAVAVPYRPYYINICYAGWIVLNRELLLFARTGARQCRNPSRSSKEESALSLVRHCVDWDAIDTLQPSEDRMSINLRRALARLNRCNM